MSNQPIGIEDEEAISRGLRDVFTFHGFEVDVVADGAEGLEKAIKGRYNLIILDVMLPSMDGFTVCEEIRKVDRELPIVMLTAKSQEEDLIAEVDVRVENRARLERLVNNNLLFKQPDSTAFTTSSGKYTPEQHNFRDVVAGIRSTNLPPGVISARL